MVFSVGFGTFCQKSDIFSRDSILEFGEIVFGFCVDHGVLEEGLVFVRRGRIGRLEASITQNILFLHDFE